MCQFDMGMEREVAVYKETLVRFTSIKRDGGGVSSRAIETLTEMAKRKTKYSREIVESIRNRWKKVAADQMLLLMYLMDSICKYPGSPYKELFQHNIDYDFAIIFKMVSKEVRHKMFELRNNWECRYQVFTHDKLHQLDLKIKEIDPGWPVTSTIRPPVPIKLSSSSSTYETPETLKSVKTPLKKRKSLEVSLASSPTREKELGHTSSLDQDTCLSRAPKVQKTQHLVFNSDIAHTSEPVLPLVTQPRAKGIEIITLDNNDDYNENIAHSPKPVGSLVVVTGHNLTIVTKDIWTLRGNNWLNDNIINFYLAMIEYRSLNDTTLPSIYVFSTYFYPKLCEGGHSAVAEWTNGRDIFSYDLLLIPIHLGNHWCLATVEPKVGVISYYNSLGSPNEYCLAKLNQYLHNEHRARKYHSLPSEAFHQTNMMNAPQQKNGYDCGVFVCTTAEYLARGQDLSFSQADMPNIRKRMVKEIKNNSL